jgi:hypothetical protein
MHMLCDLQGVPVQPCLDVGEPYHVISFDQPTWGRLTVVRRRIEMEIRRSKSASMLKDLKHRPGL